MSPTASLHSSVISFHSTIHVPAPTCKRGLWSCSRKYLSEPYADALSASSILNTVAASAVEAAIGTPFRFLAPKRAASGSNTTWNLVPFIEL